MVTTFASILALLMLGQQFETIGSNVRQDQGSWVINYRLRYIDKNDVVVNPKNIEVKIVGWVSNSRVPGHYCPKFSSVNSKASESSTQLIKTDNEATRCYETLNADLWEIDGELEQYGLIYLKKNSILRVRLKLYHNHEIYGNYDPLQGIRSITVNLTKNLKYEAKANLIEQYVAYPKNSFPEPPDERKDTKWFISPPYSINLNAAIGGDQYYRLRDCNVRYSSKVKIVFWYLIANGTKSEFNVKISQTYDTRTAWRILNNGGYKQKFNKIGKWTKVQHVLKIEPNCTTLSIEFRLMGDEELGEAWIDDISVEPIMPEIQRGP